MAQIDDLLKQELQLQRIATGLINKGLYKSLDDAYKAVRLILLDAEAITSPTKLKATERAITKAINEALAKGWSDYTSELQSIAIYDAGFYAQLIGTAATTELTVPAAKTIQSFIDSALMSLTSGRSPQVGVWADFVRNNIDSFSEQVNNLVKAGYVNNATVGQMTRTIKQFNDGLARQQAEALARTGLQHYMQSAREAMAQANADIIAARVFFATFDNRTTIGCASLHMKEWKLGDDSYVRLPRHYNCLAGDTLVSTCSGVSNVYKRAYKGAIINISTKSGRTIRITPNHPVLTARGWVAAKDINTFDKLFCVDDVSFVGEDYKNSINAKFSELFSALDVFSDPTSITNRPTTTKDFHGDITDTDVKVINVYSFAWNSAREMINKSVKNKRFIFRPFIKKAFHGLSSSCFGLKSSDSSSSGFISCINKLGNLLRTRIVHPSLLLLASVSRFKSVLFKNFGCSFYRTIKSKLFSHSSEPNAAVVSGDNQGFLFSSKYSMPPILGRDSKLSGDCVNKASTKSENISDFLESHIGFGSELDDVVSCFFSEFDGHVYNLENSDNWYTSNGIVTHNCRSVYLFRLNGQSKEDLLSNKRPAIGSGDNYESGDRYRGRASSARGEFDVEQVNATIGFDTWLKRQDPEFIEDVLGAKRAKLFIDGNLPLERMSDAFGRELSLAELAARNKAAFDRAGLG